MKIEEHVFPHGVGQLLSVPYIRYFRMGGAFLKTEPVPDQQNNVLCVVPRTDSKYVGLSIGFYKAAALYYAGEPGENGCIDGNDGDDMNDQGEGTLMTPDEAIQLAKMLIKAAMDVKVRNE